MEETSVEETAVEEQRLEEDTAAVEEQRRQEEAAAEELRQQEEAAAAQEQRRQEEAAATQEQPQPEEKRRRSRLRRLFSAGTTLKKVTGKIKQILGTPSKADKTKKVLDQPDTVANRINAPTEGGVRMHGQATSDTGQVQATAIVAQVDTGINTVTDALGAFNDGRALLAARKDRKGSGPESHKPRKDWKGKPLGVAQNSSMVVGDISGMANAAVRNAGQLAGVPALGEVTGGASVFYSTLIAIREVPVVWSTYNKNRALKEMVEEASGEAPANEGRLQDVLDRLGQVRQRLAQAEAPREQAGGPSADEETAVAALRNQILELNHLLEAELAHIGQYARHKQHTKLGKRITSLGGNTVRAAGGGLAIAGAAGALSGPAAPAVAGVAAALLLGNALYKGARAGSNRYVAARHPDRWARPTSAQDDSGTERAESPTSASASAPAPAPAPAPAERRDALKEFFKVTKSVQQGERHFMAQKLYALAAGPDVPVGSNVADDIRESARAMLIVLKAGPSQHKQSREEWEASLNNSALQTAWEKEITSQLSSA
ncbi:hypothetical protein QF026_005664 [Streptomyces aurantiacus]|nr:hypothetical protein [Streptomyces aurantiacus]